MYYLCSENKGADQLRGYCPADLRPCFRLCKKRFSHGVAHSIYFCWCECFIAVIELDDIYTLYDSFLELDYSFFMYMIICAILYRINAFFSLSFFFWK